MLVDLVIFKYGKVRKFDCVADGIVIFASDSLLRVTQLESDKKIRGSVAIIVTKNLILLVDALIL